VSEDASACVTKHVPYFVSIVSPTAGRRGNSTLSTSSHAGAWIVIMNRLMGHMMPPMCRPTGENADEGVARFRVMRSPRQKHLDKVHVVGA
jgi:hypothetical protein